MDKIIKYFSLDSVANPTKNCFVPESFILYEDGSFIVRCYYKDAIAELTNTEFTAAFEEGLIDMKDLDNFTLGPNIINNAVDIDTRENIQIYVIPKNIKVDFPRWEINCPYELKLLVFVNGLTTTLRVYGYHGEDNYIELLKWAVTDCLNNISKESINKS